MQGSFLVYNSYSGEVYNIGSVFMRVDSKTMNNQIEEEKKHFLRDNKINKLTASKRIPITIGLKLHKAKLLLFLLQKCHIAEVQPSI
jgi:aspartate--ammonia ligase